MRASRIALTLLLLLLGPGACGSSQKLSGASFVCGQDSDCSSGLKCLPFASYADGGCNEGPKACTRTCKSDSDCASLGTNFKCFAGCPGSEMFCGATS